MPGIFDQLSTLASDVAGAGSVGEGISKITGAIMAPNAATQAALDKEKADLAAKGMVTSGRGGGNVLMKRDIYGRDMEGNLAERIQPAAMPTAPLLPKKPNLLEGVEGQFTPTGGMLSGKV